MSHPSYESYIRPSFLSPTLAVTQIRVHKEGSFPSSPWQFVSCIFIYEEAGTFPPLLVDSRREHIALTHATVLSVRPLDKISQIIFFCCFFFQMNSNVRPHVGFEPQEQRLFLGRGVVLNRTYGTHKKLYKEIFLLTIFTPIILILIVAFEGTTSALETPVPRRIDHPHAIYVLR